MRGPFCIKNVAAGTLDGMCWNWCESRTKTWDSYFLVLPLHQRLYAHTVSGDFWCEGRTSVLQSFGESTGTFNFTLKLLKLYNSQ